MSNNIIEINKLRKYYDKQRGIEDVTYSINRILEAKLLQQNYLRVL